MFNEYKLRSLSVQGRIARSATNEHLGNSEGMVTDALVEYYDTLAKNGMGLIFTLHLCVAQGGRGDINQINIYDDKFIDGLSRLSAAAHSHGAKLVAQLNHVGAKVRPEANVGFPMLTPSLPGQAEAMSVEDIHAVVRAFGAAAGRAQRAGFDGVQVHMAHGYLLTQFLEPEINTRGDEYGGTPENRFRIVREIFAEIRRVCGAEYPIFVKMHCNSQSDGAGYSYLQIAHWLNELGVEAIELSGCDFSSFSPQYKEPYYLRHALQLRSTLGVPVIVVGGFRNGAEISDALERGIDMVSLSRPLLCEPDLLAKLAEDPNYTFRCRACNQCYNVYSKRFMHCALHKEPNPQLMESYAHTAL